MSEENKNNEMPDVATELKRELLMRLGKDAELFVLISLCTREPYVVCDEETFDDEIMLYLNSEDAKKAADALVEEKIPVSVAKLNGKDMLLFFTSLYTMGVNALILSRGEDKIQLQLSDIVKRKSPEEMPEGTVWVENSALHLTALYFAQELRKPATEGTKERLQELHEEIAVDFQRGSYIVALQKEEKGVPLVKMKDEKTYQPIFTDILEFQKFNRDNKFRPVVVEAIKIPDVLASEAEGIILNIMGVNLPLSVTKTKVTK